MAAVRVVAHVRAPPTSPSAVRGVCTHLIAQQPSAVQLHAPEGGRAAVSEFAFDACFASDDELFKSEVAPLVTHALAGGNASALVCGPEATVTLADAVRRCVAQLLAATQAPRVEIAFVEVDAEHVHDLLVASPSPASSRRAELSVRQLVDGSVTVSGLSHRRVATVRVVEELLEARKTANRGHSALIVYVTTTDPVCGVTRCGKLNLVDVALAGGAKSSTSVFVLGKVAAALNAGDAQHVSFRESKLTRLLQDSLGGGSRALMICCASPSSSRYQDSLHALAFASKPAAEGEPQHLGETRIYRRACIACRLNEKTVLVAKQLIAMAIDLEKKRRFRSALCLFHRAYSVLPAENARLVERMKLLETECPDAASLVPSQQVATSAYVRVVMERDLLEVVNSASVEQLVELPAIGGKRAERIVDARPFSQLGDLLHVQGITDSVLRKLVEGYTAWTPPV